MKSIMTRTFRSFSAATLALILAIPFTQGCKGSSKDPSPTDEMKSILMSGTWQLQNVTVDNVDRTSVYSGLTLAFSATSFTASNGRVIWPASGTWKFSDDTGKSITLDDALPVSIGEATSSKLVLSLSWSKTTFGGRLESVKGSHVFTFGK